MTGPAQLERITCRVCAGRGHINFENCGECDSGVVLTMVAATVQLVPLDDETTRALSRSAKAAAAAVSKRDALIVETVRAGAGVREVARAVGMNHTSVLHIIKREARRD